MKSIYTLITNLIKRNLARGRIHVGMDKMYEMDRTY